MNLSTPAPEQLVSTRLGLHRLASYVIAPLRYHATGKYGLRAGDGAFFTLPFDGREVRVEGDELIDDQNGDVRRAPITSLAAAAELLGGTVDTESASEHDTPEAGDLDADLGIDADASRWLGAWFTTAFDALGLVRADTESVDPSETQLWPGHFDPAIEAGDEDHRGSYGASPGDGPIPEPYLYLAAWWPDRLDVDFDDSFWNAPSFKGSMLKFADFPEGADPVEVAANFWRESRDRLAGRL